MKNMLKSLMSVAAAALALTSCTNDVTEEITVKGEPKTLEVNATIEQTRTTMTADHLGLQWEAGDEIYLYIGENAAKEDVIKHTIGGKITATYNNGDNVYANYSLSNSYSNGVKQAEIKIDANQTQSAANVFAGVNMPMVAKGQIQNGAVNLTFNPVGCVLVFNVYGPAEKIQGEKIKSIKFETSVGCYGYKLCDLTADDLGYEAFEKEGQSVFSATVTLTDPAAIGTSKPSDTKKGENQVYLVVAPAIYPAGSKFIVTTETKNTYTFTTSSAIDCSQYTARVVNINLEKAVEMQPAIEVPAASYEVGSAAKENILIEGITYENITAANVTAAVYSDAELNTTLDGASAWLKITNSDELANGKLSYSVAENTGAERTAYIGIKYGDVKASIAITQVAAGSTPVNMITMSAADIISNGTTTIGSGRYESGDVEQKVDDPSTYYKWKMNGVTFAGARICKATATGYAGLIQMQGNASDKNKQGFFGNADDLKKITKVVIVSKNTSYEPTEHLYVGTSAYPLGQNAVTRADLKQDGQTYTETFNVSGNYGYFTLANDKGGAFYVESVTIYYDGEAGGGEQPGGGQQPGGGDQPAPPTPPAPGESGNYVKVTENLTDWSGEYLIVYEKSDTEVYVWNLTDKSNGGITLQISEPRILSNDATNGCKVAISKSGEGYLLRATAGDKADKYIYGIKGESEIKFGTESDAAKNLHTITFDGSNAKIENNHGRSFKYSSSSNSGNRFRYYSSTAGSTHPIQLYKLQE